MADAPYYLDCELNWHHIESLPLTYVRKLFQVNGRIVLTSSDGMWVSEDCQQWKEASLPNDDDIIGIIHYKDKYVLYTEERKTYSYTKEGLFFDSEEEGYYYSTIAWQSHSLYGGWERWKEASYTSEGMILRSNIACNDDIIIAGFSYDYGFKSDMKKSSDNSCVAYFKNSKWKNTTWPEDIQNSGNFYFLNNHGIYLHFLENVIISEKGYEWRELDDMRPHDSNGGLCGNIFITVPDSNGQSLVSLDGVSISKLTAYDKGSWDVFGFGDGKLLGVYAKSKHESSLLLGTLSVIKQ